MQTIKETPTWNLMIATLIAAIILSSCSILLSILFGIILGSTPLFSIIFACALTGIAIAEFIAANHIRLAFKNHNIVGIMAGIFILLGGIAISILAGQATLQQSADALTSERRKESDTYKIALANRDNAQNKAERLYVSEDAGKVATATLAKAESDKTRLLNSRATNSNGDSAGLVKNRIGNCTGGGFYERKYCGPIQDLNAIIITQSGISANRKAYLEAKSYSDSLNVQPLPAAISQATLPGIYAISQILKVDPKLAGANIFFWLAVYMEIAAILLWLLLSTYATTPQAVERKTDVHRVYNNNFDQTDSLFAEASKAIANKQMNATPRAVKKWLSSEKKRDLDESVIAAWFNLWVSDGILAKTKRGNSERWVVK